MGKSTKEAVKERAKGIKERVKAKVKGSKVKAAAVALVAAFALLGCATSDPASRLTKAEYGDIKVCVEENVRDVTINVTIGDGAIASADSAGSTESITATPTNDVKPDTNIEVPVNKSGGGAQSVGSVFGDAVASAFKGAFTKDDKAATATAATDASATAQKSADCTDGSCTTGSCTDGSCNP